MFLNWPKVDILSDHKSINSAEETIRILVIEDEWIVAQNISETLDSAGFKVIGMEVHGEGAMVIAAAEMPDIAVVDIGLKGEIDGITVGRELDELGISVIYLTGNYEKALMEGRSSATDMLSKPIKPEELIASVEKAQERRREKISI